MSKVSKNYQWLSTRANSAKTLLEKAKGEKVKFSWQQIAREKLGIDPLTFPLAINTL